MKNIRRQYRIKPIELKFKSNLLKIKKINERNRIYVDNGSMSAPGTITQCFKVYYGHYKKPYNFRKKISGIEN